jgi:hypothetical protein
MIQSTKVTDGHYTPVSDVDIILELVDLYDSRDGYYFLSWREADISIEVRRGYASKQHKSTGVLTGFHNALSNTQIRLKLL